jgi:hypothetical protein
LRISIVSFLAMIATLELPLRIFMKRASTQLMSRTIKTWVFREASPDQGYL